MIRVFYTAGDGHGWAIDEDLRQLRTSLNGVAQSSSLAQADVVHSPFWMALAMSPAKALSERFIIAHADNPPFFYIKQAEFVRAQRMVDLWIARSREAFDQFRALALPVEYIPYTVDPAVFHPTIQTFEDKKALRCRLGLPRDTYLIANFHRDSEGANLNMPKLQKAPEFLVMVLRRLQKAGMNFHVVLAGPRRHWLRAQLGNEGIPFTFIGKQAIERDDFGVNILDRKRLNELYNASDLYIVPSRWEGGPQSVLEAAASRCKVLSTPLGVARDLLEPECLFRTSARAAEIIARDIAENHLCASVDVHHRRYRAGHTTKVMAEGVRALYGKLLFSAEFSAKKATVHHKVATIIRQSVHAINRRLPPRPLRSVAVCHTRGHDLELDEIMDNVRVALTYARIEITKQADVPLLLGWEPAGRELPGGVPVVQFVAANPSGLLKPQAVLVVPAVQDAINARLAGRRQSMVVIPFVFHGEGGDAPLIVVQEDVSASVRIWKALLAGRAVLYPENSAYYEQVFHAGLPYRDPAEIPTKLAELTACIDDVRTLACPPRLESSASALRKLLIALR